PFPYTTLFRSLQQALGSVHQRAIEAEEDDIGSQFGVLPLAILRHPHAAERAEARTNQVGDVDPARRALPAFSAITESVLGEGQRLAHPLHRGEVESV